MTNTTGSRAGAVARAETYFDSGEFEAELARRVAIKTESQKFPESAAGVPPLSREEMKPAFDAMGFTCRNYDNPFQGQGPVLLATRIEDAKLPTVLGYGHGDVVRGLEDQWTKGKGPWITARDGDRLYGRGTADNKGQHTINMAAMRAVMAERGGKLGFNAKFMIEMGEEAGSKGLKELVQSHKADFAADVFIASDGPRVKQDRPTLALGCRGAVNFDLVVDLREGGHHSGNWGGLIANPGIHPRACAGLHRRTQGRVAGRGAEGAADVGGGEGSARRCRDRRRRQGPAGRRVVGRARADAGRARLRRQHVQHSDLLDRHARTAGQCHPAEGRRQLPAALYRRHQGRRHHAGAQRHLKARAMTLVKVMPPPAINDGMFTASRTEPDHPWAAFVQGRCSARRMPSPPIMPSMGGSICNDIFTDDLGMPTIWIPHSYASCSQHWPDEHILMPLSRTRCR